MNIQEKFKNVELNKSLKELNTFKVGGESKYYLEVTDIEELSDCVKYCMDMKIDFFVLGWGSNILISDNGFNGLVVKIKNSEMKLEENIFQIGAGVMLSNFLQFSLDNGYIGAEFLAGIPGTLGGAIYGNAGTLQGISDILDSVLYVSDDGEVNEIEKADCNFSYRDSIFKENKYIIYSAKIILKKGDVEEARKTINQKIQERNKKQPLEFGNAGSFFKNIDLNDDIKDKLKGLDISSFEKSSKIPAGFLIEKVGLKGFEVGGAKVSEKHANFLINYNSATATDIYNLSKKVESVVFEKYKIKLEPEVQFIGF